jgi:hypothetical protein
VIDIETCKKCINDGFHFKSTILCRLCDNIPEHIPFEQKQKYARRILDAIL